MEIRHHPRFPTEFAVICEFRGVRTGLEAINISRGGLMVTSSDLLLVGSLVKLRFSLAGAEEIELKGLVRHTVREKGCGVEFLEVLPHQQAQLAAYLDKVALTAGPV